MKYFYDDGLAEMTSLLTDCPVGGSISQRVLHGRLEAYTMKRGTGDKKYAYKLGEKFVATLETLTSEHTVTFESIEKPVHNRKRSQSTGVFEEVLMPLSKLPRRNRSCSFDVTSKQHHDFLSSNRSLIPSALGDFAEQGTRRLMTDLILTLNMSFPDFDFGELQPTEFCYMSVPTAMERISKRLSDVALRRETFLADLWKSLDAVIHLADCDVYSYQPPTSDDADPMAFITQTLTEDFYSRDDEDNAGEKTTDSDSQPTITTIWTFNYFFVNKTIKRIVLFTCVESMRNHEIPDEDDMLEEDFVAIPPATDSTDLDFDLDPDAAPAGGIPISTI